MDYTNTEFWIAIGLGGSLIASLSAGQQVLHKDPSEPFKVKSVVRDFCFGAFLTAILFMFLPDSFHTWISAGSSAVQTVTETVKKGGSSFTSDYELQVGPARF